MVRWMNLIMPSLAGAVAFFFVGVGFWDASKQAFLVSMSVIAAGALVRLSRGFPFTVPDHYEVIEIRDIANAVEKIVRALRALIIVVFATMVVLVVAQPVWNFFANGATQTAWLERLLSGIIGFMMAYAFTRMYQVVKGDYDLTILQSKFVVRAVERRQAKEFDDSEKKGSSTKFKNPDGYGKVI